MLDDGLIQVVSKPPTRQMMAGWCVDTLKELEEGIIKNAWHHGEYSYFPEKPTEETPAQDAYDDELDEDLLDFAEAIDLLGAEGEAAVVKAVREHEEMKLQGDTLEV